MALPPALAPDGDRERRAWKNPWLGLALLLVLTLTTVQLHLQGRKWWCDCGQFSPWTSDIHSAHNSQHFLDPYSLTHVLHGVLFCGLLARGRRRIPTAWRLGITILLEALWEIFENSAFVIQRYREATVALGYQGDTIANSLGDICCCGLGFLLAHRLGWRLSLVLFLVIEILLLVWIRDNLTLNIGMLICPLDVIKEWQMAR
jgi:hypothetical protein